MDPCMEIPFQEDVLNDIVEKAKDYSLMHGTIKKVLHLAVHQVFDKKHELNLLRYFDHECHHH